MAAFKADVKWLHEMGELKDKKFEIISSYAAEIGAMVGGWIKSEKEHGGVLDDGRNYLYAKCGAKINGKIYDYSMKNYGKALCYACQKAARTIK